MTREQVVSSDWGFSPVDHARFTLLTSSVIEWLREGCGGPDGDKDINRTILLFFLILFGADTVRAVKKYLENRFIFVDL